MGNKPQNSPPPPEHLYSHSEFTVLICLNDSPNSSPGISQCFDSLPGLNTTEVRGLSEMVDNLDEIYQTFLLYNNDISRGILVKLKEFINFIKVINATFLLDLPQIYFVNQKNWEREN